jgi:D-alanine-D-alanine ligase
VKNLIIVIYNDDSETKRGSQEDIISLQSVRKTSEDVERALIESDFKTLRIGLNSKNLIRTIERIEESKPCLIFNLCEAFDGDPSQESNVAAVFELLNVAYTGSSSTAIGLTCNKEKTKHLLQQNNIPVPTGLSISKVHDLESVIWNLKFPLIIKPISEDGSIGIDRDSVVFNFDKLKEKFEYISDTYHQAVVIEEYIEGREFNVSIIGNNQPRIFPVAEIDYSKIPPNNPKILCYKSKWIKESDSYRLTPPVCPANITSEIEKGIKEVALKAFEVTGCRDYARVDIRLDNHNTPFVLEVNANPDLSIDSGMIKSATAEGWPYNKLIKCIVNSAKERFNGNKN